jgi:cell shape-determining protein MreC
MSLSRRRVLALLILTTILLITFDLRGNSVIDRSRETFGSVMDPFQEVGRFVSKPFVNAWHGIADYGDVKKENDRLRDQIDQQKADSLEARTIIREYHDLLQRNGLEASGYSEVTAAVVSSSPSDFQVTVEINRGRKRGIQPGMPVVSYAGLLVGRVIRADDDSATVRLLTDNQFSVPAKVVAQNPNANVTGDDPPPTAPPVSSQATTTTAPPATTAPPSTTVPPTTPAPTTTAPSLTTTTLSPAQLPVIESGSVEGSGRDELPVFTLLDSNRFSQTIKHGDVVATSGGTPEKPSLAPPDIPIGVVEKVTRRAGVAGPDIQVRPAADLDQLSFVRVVLYVPSAPGQ